MTALSHPTTILTHSADRERAAATLLIAFGTDPVIRWLFPDPATYLTAFPQLLELMGGSAFETGTADRGDTGAAVALWVVPGVEPDTDAIAGLLERSIDPGRHDEVFDFLEQAAEHLPEAPCWYLPFMGVDPRCQGQGLGSQLLAQGLGRSDRDGLPAYLEATSPLNRRLYERHGFEAVGEIKVGDGAPPLVPMLRPASR